MPDPDRNAPEFMDAPGTRVTPEPDEHPGHDAAAGSNRGRGDGAAPGGRLSRNAANGGAADAIRTDVPAGSPDDIRATEGGTGTAGSRGGGPAADFSDDPAPARGGDASRG